MSTSCSAISPREALPAAPHWPWEADRRAGTMGRVSLPGSGHRPSTTRESRVMTLDPSGSTSTDRRSFLQAGALAAAAATAGHAAGAQEPGQGRGEGAEKALAIPRRPLGKTGIDVTMLNAGTGRGAGIQRILRYAYSQGIRCFDTSQR